MDSITLLILLGGLVAAVGAALCTVAEAALTTLTRSRAVALGEVHARAAERLIVQLERRDQVVQAVLLARMLLVLATAAAVATVAGWAAGIPAEVAALFGLAPVLHLFSVALPRAWAQGHATRAASVAARVAALADIWPLRIAASLVQRLARRLTPAGRSVPGFALPELAELAELAERAEAGAAGNEANGGDGSPAGEGDDDGYDGRGLISSVVAFGHTVTREVMVPRPDMVTLQADLPVSQAWRIADEERYSRYPVEGDGIDDIVGVAFAKDLLHAALDGRGDERVSQLMHPAWFVPETKRVAPLLREMQRDKLHLAVVVDEYGGTAGLVTLEDVLEELVGEIADEFDEEPLPLAQRLDDGRVRLDARLLVEAANQLLDEPLPEGHWDTVAGLVYATLGHVPCSGEVAEVDGQRVEVERVVGRRIETVLVGERP
jgi:CBS domain containing-hemolysin-like protein